MPSISLRLPYLALLALAGLLFAAPALAFQATGSFSYEDRMWDHTGYTGLVQNLPVRFADVEIVDAGTMTVIGSGSTDADGNYDIAVTGQTLPLNMFARCLTDGAGAGYYIRVVDDFQRDFVNGQLILTASSTHAVVTSTALAHDPAFDYDFGDYLIQDPDGTGVAQAYNIFDNAVDYFDWMNQPGLLGRLPNASEFVVFGWSPTSANEGSNYSLQGILIASPGQGNDTDGWADTVILHEAGHWHDDVFSRSDNPGGPHFLGDNDANVLLAYGEGSATYHCAKVREFRAPRLNPLGQPVDDHISIYADLQIPPALPNPGGLSFSYDFETGAFGDGTPIGQRGSANETNVTSVLWDLLDGPSTPDETPGVDDDQVEVGDDVAWDIETTYLLSVAPSNPITVEDYYQGWFAQNGATFMKTEVDFIFNTLGLMPFYVDAGEPDNTLPSATPLSPLFHAAAPGGGVVINEIDPGVQDAVELYNAGDTAVDLTGWQIEVYVNGVTNDASRIYTFGAFTLNPGEVVSVYERGDPLNNGAYHLYAGETPGAFNMSWFHGSDGAAVLRDASTNPVDFVKWRDIGGVDNTTPVPPGATFTGTLISSLSPFNLGRDVSGTDTDTAADFTSVPGTLASANHPSPISRTVFDIGDTDVFSFNAVAGTRYGFEARGPFSKSDPRIELLSPSGAVLGANSSSDPGVRDSRVDFYANTTDTYYIRVSHEGANTDYAEYDLLAFERPVASVFAPPSSITATANNATDTGDGVNLQWLNAGAYDEVNLYRDGVLIANLTGAPGDYVDSADRGLYFYEVSGVLGGQETARIGTYEFAGVVECTSTDDFESGTSANWITQGSSWDVTPLAESGVFGFTDSPGGTYQGCPTGGGCTVNAIAVLGVPAKLPPGASLEFDQICITEDDFDFCIVELSNDDGQSWTELARYDQGDDPAWGDNVADPTDWRHVSLDLSAWANQEVLLRFRLQSDQLIELDGWYVDNVDLGNFDCSTLSVDPGAMTGLTPRFLAPSPNPMRSSSVFSFYLPEPAAAVDLRVFDVAGRLTRAARLDAVPAGLNTWSWDGRDESGRSVASGLYFVRLSTPTQELSQRVMKVAR